MAEGYDWEGFSACSEAVLIGALSCVFQGGLAGEGWRIVILSGSK